MVPSFPQIHVLQLSAGEGTLVPGEHPKIYVNDIQILNGLKNIRRNNLQYYNDVLLFVFMALITSYHMLVS